MKQLHYCLLIICLVFTFNSNIFNNTFITFRINEIEYTTINELIISKVRVMYLSYSIIIYIKDTTLETKVITKLARFKYNLTFSMSISYTTF
jgi:hypothetical protein